MEPTSPAPSALSDPAVRFFAQIASVPEGAGLHAELTRLKRLHGAVPEGRSLNLQRVDLGSRGIFFRLLIGPYAQRSPADRLCRDLRAAARDCLVLMTKDTAIEPY